MFNIPKIINKTLSVRLSLMVVLAMTLLLMSSLVFMLHYSRKAVKEEALQKAKEYGEMIKKKYKIKKLELWVGVNVGEIGEIC